MMHNDRRPHVEKRREELREREARSAQPGPGDSVEAERTGAEPGATTGTAGEPNGGVDTVVESVRDSNTGGYTPRSEIGIIPPATFSESTEAGTISEGESVGLGEGALHLTPSLKAKGWAARKAGAYVARKFGKKPDEGPLAAGTTASKGAKQAVISASAVYVALQGLRGFKPEWIPWPAEQDEAMIGMLCATVGAVGLVIGSLKNLWKNISKLRNGIALTKKQ